MTAYATAAEFGARYATKLTDAEINSHFLHFASARLDALLAPSFTVPFSSNNVAAKDLTIELAYLLILRRGKEPKDHAPLAGQVAARVAALARGEEAMITTSGEALFATAPQGDVWSNTSGGAPLFDLSVDGLTATTSGEWT